MSKDKKPGSSRGELLDELSSIQTLLGDAAQDVEQQHLDADDDDIPVLPPVGADEDGDAHNQIPLLGGDAEENPADVRKAATSRDNPFLPKATLSQARQNRDETSKAIEAMIQQRTAAAQRSPATPAAATPPRTTAPTLSDAQVRALVDEILAAWMPKLERELRARLIDELKPDA